MSWSTCSSTNNSQLTPLQHRGPNTTSNPDDTTRPPPSQYTTEAELPPYHHVPLNPSRGQYRLIWLYPGTADDDLMVAFDLISSDPGGGASVAFVPPFEAVSYTWGSIKQPFRVKCTDCIKKTLGGGGTGSEPGSENNLEYSCPQTAKGWLPITANVLMLLRSLRYNDGYRALWVDAVCIDQNDLDEKSQQVRMMSSFYRAATQTIVYLGESDEETEVALRTVVEIASMEGSGSGNGNGLPEKLNEIPLTRPRPSHWPQSLAPPPGTSTTTTPASVDSERPIVKANSFALASLVRRPWFSRTWVIQELALSKTVELRVGEYSIGWSAFILACSKIAASGSSQAGMPHGQPSFYENIGLALDLQALRLNYKEYVDMPEIKRDRQSQERDPLSDQMELHRLLIRTRNSEATDPRDKVFSLLRLSSTGSSDWIDYRMTLNEVYLLAAEDWLKWQQSPEFLDYVFSPRTNQEVGLPSWVPNWALADLPQKEFFPRAICRAGIGQPNSFSSFPQRSAHVQNLVPLRVSGVSLFEISAVADVVAGIKSHAELMNTFPDPYPTTSRSYIQCYRDVLDPGSDSYQLTTDRPQKFWDHCEERGRKHLEPGIADIETPRYTPDQLLEALQSPDSPFYRVNKLVKGRRFCITTTGFMCLVPEEAEAGDIICVVFGCSLPYVVRRRDEETYSLIGHCFVYGIMNGEAMDELPPEKSEIFVLV